MEKNIIKELNPANQKYKCLFGCFVDIEEFFKEDGNKEKSFILFTREPSQKGIKKCIKILLKQIFKDTMTNRRLNKTIEYYLKELDSEETQYEEN